MRARQDDNEADLPGWVAVLDPRQRPIDTKKLNKDELVAAFEKRFIALLQKSDSINSLEGWRAVAVDLAFEFHPAFKIGSSGNRVDESNGKCGSKPHGYWVFGVS